MIKVLFVCTGNICRSPTAEAVFRALTEKEGLGGRFHVDSAGTEAQHHAGEAPDPRAIRVARRNGVDLGGAARRVEEGDFFGFDYIFAMDGGHLDALRRRRPADATAKIAPFLPAGDVPDPWYGGEKDFESVFALVHDGSRTILDHIKKDHSL